MLGAGIMSFNFIGNLILNPVPLSSLVKCSGGSKLAIEFKCVPGFWYTFGQMLAVRLDLYLRMLKHE